MEQLKYTEILQQNKLLAGKLNTTPYRISILSNVTVNPLQEILEYNCRIHQIEPDVVIGNFDNIVQDSAAARDRDMVIVLYDIFSVIDDMGLYFDAISDQALESLKARICSEIDLIFANLKAVPAVVFNMFSASLLSISPLQAGKAKLLTDYLNQYLKEKKTTNIHLADIDQIFMHTGLKQAIDFRFYYSSKAPYTIAFFKEYTLALQHLVLQNTGKLKKALIFDCDNTLWKGIIGEDGPEGIDMSPQSKQGRYFNQVQQMAAYLSTRGIIIGLCSKNNPQDVAEVLQSDAMILKNDHIVIQKVNWEDKATNLRGIAAELNIGTDSLVFVDDSPFEINLVKEQLPEILTLQVPANLADYPSQLQKLVSRYFPTGGNTEDSARTAMYKQQFEREDARNTFVSIEDYLASLEIVVTVSHNDIAQIPRIAQLTQKTNQFNLTTKRYTESQIEAFMKSGQDIIFAIFVRDKFGDSGLTGICIIKQDEQNGKKAIVDSLLMSCRIIGRNIEYVFLDHVVTFLKDKGYEEISASFIPTKKNAQVANFYNNKQFVQTGTNADGSKEYQLPVADYQPGSFGYIRLEVLQDQPLSNL